MTKITNFCFLSLFFFAAHCCHAQERIDATLPIFIKKSEPLTKATGYRQNETSGKWIENSNLISDMEVNPLDSASRGYTNQNIYWFRTATLSYGGKKYYAFYYYYLSGQYKYPETKVDWVPFPATKFMIVDSANYFAFKKAVLQKKGETQTIKSRMFNTFEMEGEYDEAKMLAAMGKEIKNEYPTGTDCFPANTQTLNGKDIARFRLFANCLLSKYFATEYFEISYEDFKKLFVE